MRDRIVNLLWLCVEQFGRIFSSLLITILIVQQLGVEQFGTLSLALAVLTTFSAIVALGFDSVLFKKFISKDDNISLLQVSSFLRLIMAISIIGICFIINFTSNELYLKILNVLVLGFIFDSFLGFKDYFAAHLKNKFYTYSTLFAIVSQLLLVYFLVYMNFSIEYFAWSYVLAKAIQAAFLFFFFYKTKKQIIFPEWNKSLSIHLLKSSYPMMLAASIGLIYSLQDQYFIKYFLGEYELGLYVVGMKFILILVVLPTLISNVFYPSLVSKFNAKKEKDYNDQMEGLYLMFFVFGLILFLTILFLSDFIILNLFGSEFKGSISIMKIFSFLLILSFFQSLNNKILILNGLQSVIFKRAILALTINATLNFIFIPKFGIEGAAYSTIISEVFVLVSYSFRKDTRFIFNHQIKAILLLNLFNIGVIRSIKS